MLGGGVESANLPLLPQILLLMLPTLLATPPAHPLHVCSLRTSLMALRRCLRLQNLGPDEECQACLGLAEFGMKVVGAGLHAKQENEWKWAWNIEVEIQNAVGRGLMLCEKITRLRIYKVHLTCLAARFHIWQQNTRLVRSQLRHLQNNIYPTDPAYLHYMTYVSLISIATSATPPDYSQALQQTAALKTLANKQEDHNVSLLADITQLKILVDAGWWGDVPASLKAIGKYIGLNCLAGTEIADISDPLPKIEDSVGSAMAVYALVLGTVHHTQVGSAKEAAATLGCLHSLLDQGALEKFPDGRLAVPVNRGPPLRIEVSHPKILLQLAFLVSSVSKRDCVGRRPRRKVFAEEGIHLLDQEAQRAPTILSIHSSLRDMEGVELTLKKIKADLMCELVSVAIIRSEFEKAESLLAELVSFLRGHELFPSYSARVSLHHGHLAHALGKSSRAAMCYQASAHLAGENTWIWAAARTGEIALQIGLGEGQGSSELPDDLMKWCHSACGSLQGVAKVIEACLSKEITKSKQCLKASLDSSTAAQDNHLRALILALTSYHYFHTASEHAVKMLQTARQLAAGMGAPEKDGDARGPESMEASVSGNAPLGLWIGERFLEIYSRQGRLDKIEKQKEINHKFQQTMSEIAVLGQSQIKTQ